MSRRGTAQNTRGQLPAGTFQHGKHAAFGMKSGAAPVRAGIRPGKKGNFHSIAVPGFTEFSGRDKDVIRAFAGCVFGAHKCGSGTLDGEDAAQAFQAGCRRPCPAAQVNDESLICQSAQCFKHRALGPPGQAQPSHDVVQAQGSAGGKHGKNFTAQGVIGKRGKFLFFQGVFSVQAAPLRRCHSRHHLPHHAEKGMPGAVEVESLREAKKSASTSRA